MTTIQGSRNITGDLVVAGLINSGSSAGSTDTFTLTLPSAPAAYAAGQRFSFIANAANTGACTLNVNSLGAKSIKKAAGGITTALAANDIRSGQAVDVIYDGTNMQMLSGLGNAAGGGASAGIVASGYYSLLTGAASHIMAVSFAANTLGQTSSACYAMQFVTTHDIKLGHASVYTGSSGAASKGFSAKIFADNGSNVIGTVVAGSHLNIPDCAAAGITRVAWNASVTLLRDTAYWIVFSMEDVANTFQNHQEGTNNSTRNYLAALSPARLGSATGTPTGTGATFEVPDTTPTLTGSGSVLVPIIIVEPN